MASWLTLTQHGFNCGGVSFLYFSASFESLPSGTIHSEAARLAPPPPFVMIIWSQLAMRRHLIIFERVKENSGVEKKFSYEIPANQEKTIWRKRNCRVRDSWP